MYKDADEEIAKFASYRAYLKAKEKSEAQKPKPPRDQCLSPPSRWCSQTLSTNYQIEIPIPVCSSTRTELIR